MLWKVTVNAGYMNGHPHVAFGAGWKQFMEYHDVVEGDCLLFELFGNSLFNVTAL